MSQEIYWEESCNFSNYIVPEMKACRDTDRQRKPVWAVLASVHGQCYDMTTSSVTVKSSSYMAGFVALLGI